MTTPQTPMPSEPAVASSDGLAITFDLAECREWIVIIEALIWRFRKRGMKPEADACLTLLVALSDEHERHECQPSLDLMANAPDQTPRTQDHE